MQFHTGLGDNDITLTRSSPANLQPLIKAHPNATFVLLHSSYPYTRDAGYLTSVYANVYLDFGEIFPFLSSDGQRTVLRQVFELTPMNKIMWSSACIRPDSDMVYPDEVLTLCSGWALVARKLLSGNNASSSSSPSGSSSRFMSDTLANPTIRAVTPSIHQPRRLHFNPSHQHREECVFS